MNKIAVERARSLQTVQVVFAGLAVLSLMAAMGVATRGDDLGLPESSSQTIAVAFLMVGAFDTALLFAWEKIFQRMQA
jgi:hypothetical protein